jgi:hypothetical protein
MDNREITRRLNANLGVVLVAGLAGSTDRAISRAWSQMDGPLPDVASQKRPRFAYDQWRAVGS